MKNSTAPNRKTGRMIAKNLIVLFTVALAAFYGIQAWFTDKQPSDADASTLSVMRLTVLKLLLLSTALRLRRVTKITKIRLN